MSDFLVKRDDLRECRIVESEVPELEPGQALLRVEQLRADREQHHLCGVRAGHVLLGLLSRRGGMGPRPDVGLCRGASEARPRASSPACALYGYLPPSSYLVVTPAHASGDGFVDGSPHRAALPSAYQSYLATDADPFYRADTEELQMLLRPLFFTSFLIDDQLSTRG